MMYILVKFLVAVHNGQSNIQIIRVGNISDITQSGGYVFDINIASVWTGTEFLRMLLNYEATGNYVVLLSAPKVTVKIEPEVLLWRPN